MTPSRPFEASREYFRSIPVSASLSIGDSALTKLHRSPPAAGSSCSSSSSCIDLALLLARLYRCRDACERIDGDGDDGRRSPRRPLRPRFRFTVEVRTAIVAKHVAVPISAVVGFRNLGCARSRVRLLRRAVTARAARARRARAPQFPVAQCRFIRHLLEDTPPEVPGSASDIAARAAFGCSHAASAPKIRRRLPVVVKCRIALLLLTSALFCYRCRCRQPPSESHCDNRLAGRRRRRKPTEVRESPLIYHSASLRWRWTSFVFHSISNPTGAGCQGRSKEVLAMVLAGDIATARVTRRRTTETW